MTSLYASSTPMQGAAPTSASPFGPPSFFYVAQHHEVTYGNFLTVALLRHRHLPLDTHAGDHLRSVLATSGPDALIPGEARCKACRRQRIGIWCRRVQSNGLRVGTLRCLVCGYEMASRGANKIYEDCDLLPLWSDSRTKEPCEKCGSKDGTELHHWAPRHLFDDADEWPVSHLCRSCHALWHRIVTPKMSQHGKAA